MVIMSGTATVLQQFVSGLKSRNEDNRAKSAKDLQHYVTTELREVTQLGWCYGDVRPFAFSVLMPLCHRLFKQARKWLYKHSLVQYILHWMSHNGFGVFKLLNLFSNLMLILLSSVKPRWSYNILRWVKPPHIWAGIQLWCEWKERRDSCHW